MILYLYLLFLARGSGPDIALGLSSRKAPTVNGGPAGKTGQKFWTHQSWVHDGKLMYPPTCPPTRMLRQLVSQECTQPTFGACPPSQTLSSSSSAITQHNLVTPPHHAIQPRPPTTSEGSSLGAIYSTRKRHLNPLHLSGAQNIYVPHNPTSHKSTTRSGAQNV